MITSTHPPPVHGWERARQAAKAFRVTQLLVEVLTGDVVEFWAQNLIAGQHDVTGGHTQRWDVVPSNSWVHEHLKGMGLCVLLNLLLPLLEDGLGAYDKGGLAGEGLNE